MIIPVAIKCTTLLLLLLLSAKFSNHSCSLSSLSTSPAGEHESLVPPQYGILVVQNSRPDQEYEDDYFVVHYNQQNIPRLRDDVKFYPLIHLPDPHDICYDPEPDSQQFRDAVLLIRYETVLRCNLSSQARDVEERGGRGLLIQLPRHVLIPDVQVGQRATIDPSFFIALISDRTTESILRKDHQHLTTRVTSPGKESSISQQNNWSNDSSVRVAIFAPHTLDATSLIPLDLKTLAVWVTAVITLILGTYFSSGRKQGTAIVKKKFPLRVHQMHRRRNRKNSSKRRNSSAGETRSASRFTTDDNEDEDDAGPEADKRPEEECEQQQEKEDDEEDVERKESSNPDHQNKPLLQILLLVCWLAVLPFVLFIFFNFIAYFMVAVFAIASIVILYVCCDSGTNDQGLQSASPETTTGNSHSRSGSCSSSCVKRGHHHQQHRHHHRRRREDENEAGEQITSASTSSSNSASTITSLSVARKLLLNHRPPLHHHPQQQQQHLPQQQQQQQPELHGNAGQSVFFQRSTRGSLIRSNAVTSDSPQPVTRTTRGRLRRSNTSGSSETGSIEEDSLYYHRPHHRHQEESSFMAPHPQFGHRFHHPLLMHETTVIPKYNRHMLPSRSCDSAMSSCPSTMATVGPILSSSASAPQTADPSSGLMSSSVPVMRRPLHHRSSSILKQSHYQNSSFETSEGQSDTTTSRSLSRQTTFSSRDPDQEIASQSGISVSRPFLKSGYLETCFQLDETSHKLVLTVVQVSEICLSSSSLRSSPAAVLSPAAHVVVHLALLPHKRQKFKTRVRLCSDESCVKFEESFCFQKIDPSDVCSMGCRFRLYSCELLRRQSLIGETVLSFASCKPLPASETKIILTLEQKSRFSVSSLSFRPLCLHVCCHFFFFAPHFCQPFVPPLLSSAVFFGRRTLEMGVICLSGRKRQNTRGKRNRKRESRHRKQKQGAVLCCRLADCCCCSRW